MNKQVLETEWVQAREFLRDKWGNLTEEDIRQINGRYDQLVAKLQQRYGYTREQAEEEIRKWNFERGGKPIFTADKPYVRQEERFVRKDEGSSFFKWLLAIAIPLLLLALYFGATKTPEVTTTPVPTSYENSAVNTETPADQTLAQTIRQAISNSPQFQDFRNVRINANNGVITVSGTVATAQQRDRIMNILNNVGGVRQINNQIEVQP